MKLLSVEHETACSEHETAFGEHETAFGEHETAFIGCSSALRMRNTVRAAPVRKSVVLPLGYQYPTLSESATGLGFREQGLELPESCGSCGSCPLPATRPATSRHLLHTLTLSLIEGRA
jgi:hypothetical protein